MLDELTAAGEVIWAGVGSLAGNDGWVALCPADLAPLLLPVPDDTLSTTPLHRRLLAEFDEDSAVFFRRLSQRVAAHASPDDPPAGDAELLTALWDLVWAGHVSNDTFAPVRALISGGRAKHTAPRRAPRSRYARPTLGGAGRAALTNAAATTDPTAGGRWSLLPTRDIDRETTTRRARALAEALLDRHGVLTRGAVAAEHIAGGFAAVYPVLTAFEETGRCRRGYFVEGLGGAQFAVLGAVDRLRALHADAERRATEHAGEAPRAMVLAATDPANAYGASLPWPARPGDSGSGHKPGRKAGALVVLVDGALVLYVERGGKSLLSWTNDDESLRLAAEALALAVREGWLGRMTVARTDGAAVLGSGGDAALSRALESAGFRATPQGLRLRG
jgi:ATP-dependent Lhr-like helicase